MPRIWRSLRWLGSRPETAGAKYIRKAIETFINLDICFYKIKKELALFNNEYYSVKKIYL